MLSFQGLAQFFLWFGFIFLVVLYSIPIPFIESSDEIFVVLLGAVALLRFVSGKKNKVFFPWEKKIFLLWIIVTCLGLLASLIYRYQGYVPVLSDLFVFSKVFLAYFFSRYCFSGFSDFVVGGKGKSFLIVAFLAIALIVAANKVLGLYPAGEVRFGFATEYLFFGHASRYSSFFSFTFCLLLPFFYKKGRWVLILVLLVGLLGLRSKYMGFCVLALAFLIFYRTFIYEGAAKLTKFALLSAVSALVIYVSIDQILYYYSIDAFWDGYVRSVMSYYSGVIAVDHFPLGVGFGAFGSWFSGVFYSPIYFDYGIYDVYGITPENYHYIADFYWAMVLGQFGGVGLVLLLMTYFLLFRGLYFLGMSVPAGLNQKDVDRIKLLVFSALLVLIALLIDSTGDSILTQSRGVWAFYYISLVVSQLASLGKNRALKYE